VTVPDTVKLPGIGPVDERYVYAAGALVVGVAGWAWWRRGTAGPSSAAEPPIDGAAEGVDDGSAWPYRPPGGSTVEPGAGGSAPSTREEWAAAALAALESVLWDTDAAAGAIAKYLAGQQLTAREALGIQTAWALVGAVPGGNPPLRLAPITTTTPPPAGTGSKPADYLAPGIHRIGKLGGTYTMRSIAARATLLPHSADKVESRLRAIVRANPKLRGRTSVPGGTVVIVPPF